MAVIGFVDWRGFVAELRADPPEGGVVRVQKYTRNTPSPNIGQDWIDYRVVVAAVTEGGNLAVARFSLGGAWDFDLRHDRRKVETLEENASAVVDIITRALVREGFEVRSGIIAGSEEAKVVTDPPADLWQWEDGRVVELQGEWDEDETVRLRVS